jgi:8-oxo-dGTP pyrophosphatase MutT (NUDIX family)
MTSLSVVPIDHLELVLAPRPWLFADQHRSVIDAHFAARKVKTPELWNGRVLLLHEAEVIERTMRGVFFETDFASFIAWRDWGFPEAGAVNCFAMGALRASGGAFLLGVMGPHTANAGDVYFPCGTPDPQDVVEGQVDLAGSVMREVAEETGLGADDVMAAPGWHAVLAGPRIALIKVLHLAERAETVRERILQHLAGESWPELVDIRIVRSPADFSTTMPAFVTAFLRREWVAAGRLPAPT